MARLPTAASLGLIIMACPCSKLLAGSPFSMPVVEEFVRGKTTKGSGFLDDLINHNAYTGKIPPFVPSPNSTHLIFAMNYENEQGEIIAEGSEASDGAGAQQPQPLMDIPLPPMNHAQITAIILGLNTGIANNTLNTMLSYIPITPPDESLTIASMIQQVQQVLHISADSNQNAMIGVLTNIMGTESPVDMTKPEDQQNLAILMLSYYTIIHSNESLPQVAHALFDSFLFHATGLSGIERLHAGKRDLLGTLASINDHDVLKANVKESASVFSGLKLLGEMRLKILQQLGGSPEAENSEASADPMLLAAYSLLNFEVNKNLTPLYQYGVESAEQMLMLIEEYGEKDPESVASNMQFMSFLYATSLKLEHLFKKIVSAHVDNMPSCFSQSDTEEDMVENYVTIFRKLELKIRLKRVLNASNENPGNENPELFQKFLLALEKFITNQLEKPFIGRCEFTCTMLSLGTIFDRMQINYVVAVSTAVMAMFPPTVNTNVTEQVHGAIQNKAEKRDKEKELSIEEKEKERRKEEERIKYLKKREKYLDDFTEWFDANFDYSVEELYGSENIEAVRARVETFCGSENIEAVIERVDALYDSGGIDAVRESFGF
ncbi:hypothetical protein [Endozoicomonas sp. ALD040]|uniref:hypothetical protein n=1 Tax=Endozoicomonas sp. ALD040 TaxID=3403079 RepID=UPI003BAF9050